MDMLQLRKIFPRNYDVVSPDYDVSQSCRFSHGTAHMCICYVEQNTPVSRPKCQGKCSHGPYSPVTLDTYCWILKVLP